MFIFSVFETKLQSKSEKRVREKEKELTSSEARLSSEIILLREERQSNNK